MTIIVPVYNVARYLPRLLASLSRQTLDIASVQVVFVDDGSTDDSLAIVTRWAEKPGGSRIVVEQENAWVSAARNAGLAVATGRWVTFVDADDELGDSYLAEIAKMLAAHDDGDLALVVAHQLRMDDTGRLSDNHSLRLKFSRGSRVVDIRREPLVQMSVNSAFFLRHVLAENGIAFDLRIKPVFEDAHFVARYLLASTSPKVGLAASAKYHYRTRNDGTSLMQTHFDKPEKYTSVLRHGHLELLTEAAEQGPIPRWLENMVLYDLFWYLRNEQDTASRSAAAPPEVFDEFHGLMREIVQRLSAESIASFAVMGVDDLYRRALLAGYTDWLEHPHHVVFGPVDETKQLICLSYWFVGELPRERTSADGEEIVAEHETVQDFTFYGRVLLRKRVLWVARGGGLRLAVAGRFLDFQADDDLAPESVLTEARLRPTILRQRPVGVEPFVDLETTISRHLSSTVRGVARSVRQTLSRASMKDHRLALEARSSKRRALYDHAWVFMDRDTDAGDNAEHLYRYVRNKHPEINAWFVLRRDSRDWSRLAAEGFRLVEYQSDDWRILLLRADHLASSHIDSYVVDPLDERRYGRPHYRFTFLQHGVINYDMSRWLNTKKPDLFVVTTPAEHAAIAGHGPYRFSSREVRLTGLPRHDALLSKRSAVPPNDRRLFLVAPTWRKDLLGEQRAGSNERSRLEDFSSSSYATHYAELLGDPRLTSELQSRGLELAFMPHPNIRPYLESFGLGPDVTVLDYATSDIQDVLARTAVFVTDYSSLAFDAALLSIPMIYFHFDADAFFDGSHARRGYFSYLDDGFGPVATTVGQVVDAATSLDSESGSPSPLYETRMTTQLVLRDGSNAGRVVDRMLELDQRGPR